MEPEIARLPSGVKAMARTSPGASRGPRVAQAGVGVVAHKSPDFRTGGHVPEPDGAVALRPAARRENPRAVGCHRDGDSPGRYARRSA